MDYFVIVWHGQTFNQRPQLYKIGTYAECQQERKDLIFYGTYHKKDVSVYSERTIPEHLNVLLPDKYFY